MQAQNLALEVAAAVLRLEAQGPWIIRKE
jgi:hypothetical protein